MVRRAETEAPRFRHLLVADDASYAMRGVEEFAARIAKTVGATLDVVVVGARALDPQDRANEVMFGRATADAEAAAAGIRRRFEALGVAVTVHIERGPVAEALVAVERRLRPDLVLFGHTKRAHMEFSGYGTTLDQVKNTLTASVLVAQRPAFDAIAVGVDGSEPSHDAARAAAQWAARFGLPLTILLGQGARKPRTISAQATVAVQGPPGDFLLEWSRQNPSTLLVVGARGLGNPHLLRMGSVSDRLAWGAGSSVLVVRPSRTQVSAP